MQWWLPGCIYDGVRAAGRASDTSRAVSCCVAVAKHVTSPAVLGPVSTTILSMSMSLATTLLRQSPPLSAES